LLPDLPVAVGSGRLDDAIAAQFKALNAVRLDKPYSQDTLTGALRSMLAARPRPLALPLAIS
jgi:hypothetical protein